MLFLLINPKFKIKLNRQDCVIQIFQKKEQNVYSFIEIIEMAQFFQSPKIQTYPPGIPYAQISSPSSQSATIQNLRRENQFLKHQLEAMMRNQIQKVAPNNQMTPKLYSHNSEEQAEQAYKDKICRLKMKKSPRNSIERNTTTIPNSPRNSIEYKKTTNNTPRNSLKVSQLAANGQNESAFRPLNVAAYANNTIIVSSKQKDLKNYQANDADQKMITVRKNNPSQPKMISFIPTSQNPIMSHQKGQTLIIKLQPRPQRPTHQRVQSYQPQSIYLPEKTQRIQQTRCNNPFSPVNKASKLRVNSKDKNLKQEPVRNYRMSEQLQQKADAIFIKKQIPKQKVFENINVKINVGKGTLNNEKPLKAVNQQAQTKKNRDELSEGDSCLSIERNMREERGSRKLRYNVYMEQTLNQH